MTRLLALALLLPLALTSCGDDSQGGGGETTLTVFAASSLTTPFERIAHDFEAAHPGVQVKLSFGGSSDLVAQVQEGAPADVVATADTATMAELTADHLTGADPRDFATNTLEIATPPDNPAHVTGFADLARPGTQLVVCAPEVPCGAATATMADQVGVRLHPVSEEQSVTDVLAKVTAGEADAGVVYVTDVRGAGDSVHAVPLPESSEVVNTYPIAPIAGSQHEALARRFVALVLSDAGQQVLGHAGFGPPGP